MLNFSSSDYLPDSEKRLEHLQKIINGRPVAILAAGPSIGELEKRIGELRHTDICYFGMNTFFVHEDHILRQINKRFSVVMAGINRGLPPIISQVETFLQRPDSNLFVSSFYESQPELLGSQFHLNDFLRRFDVKLLFISASRDKTVPTPDRPLHFPIGNTLAQLINTAVIGGASKIVIFGGDGFVPINTGKSHYRQEEYGTSPPDALIIDTYKHFNPVLPIGLRNIYRTYQLKPIEILNCSEKSFYTPFPTISYDHVLSYLTGQEKYNSSWDTRPKPWIRLKRELVLFQLPQAKKTVGQRLRAVIKFVLPRSWFLVIHRQLQRWRKD